MLKNPYLFSSVLLCLFKFPSGTPRPSGEYETLETLSIDEALQELYFKKDTFSSYDETSLPLYANASKFTKVYVFTRETGENYTEIILGNVSSFTDSSFKTERYTKVLVHGWMAGALKTFENELRETYLEAQDVNVLAVDWSALADNVLYPVARAAVEPVGAYLAEFIDWLVSEAGVILSSLHIIGHSLGAHISGVAGEVLTVGRISRITGLDPAGPGFSKSNTSGRLDSSDAQFVDVIHTCGKWAGFYDACGHVDFYPNKGEPTQPGCKKLSLVCSHVRSHDIFNESITSYGFVSTSCDSWDDFSQDLCENSTSTIMGEHVDLSARGNYYLYTSGEYPYALGNKKPMSINNKMIAAALDLFD